MVLEYLARAHDPILTSETSSPGISLNGGRDLGYCAIELIGSDEDAALVIRLTDEGSISRQRTFRAALRCLNRLSLGLASQNPEIAAALDNFIAMCSAGRESPPMERLIPAWGGSAPTGVVVLTPGTALPLVVRIRTTCPPATLDSYLNIACAWVLPRERTWTQGLTAKKRTENRHYTMRSVSQVRLDGTLKRMFRYGEGGLTPLAKHRVTDGQMPWFWQITGAFGEREDGRTEALLSISSLSRTQDILCYGQELARFLAAFEWQVNSSDASAEYKSVGLMVSQLAGSTPVLPLRTTQPEGVMNGTQKGKLADGNLRVRRGCSGARPADNRYRTEESLSDHSSTLQYI